MHRSAPRPPPQPPLTLPRWQDRITFAFWRRAAIPALSFSLVFERAVARRLAGGNRGLCPGRRGGRGRRRAVQPSAMPQAYCTPDAGHLQRFRREDASWKWPAARWICASSRRMRIDQWPKPHPVVHVRDHATTELARSTQLIPACAAAHQSKPSAPHNDSRQRNVAVEGAVARQNSSRSPPGCRPC